jgi:hypothetical protein
VKGRKKSTARFLAAAGRLRLRDPDGNAAAISARKAAGPLRSEWQIFDFFGVQAAQSVIAADCTIFTGEVHST